MEQIGDFFVDTTMKCWACGVFDNLFAIISDSAALMYNQLAIFGVVLCFPNSMRIFPISLDTLSKYKKINCYIFGMVISGDVTLVTRLCCAIRGAIYDILYFGIMARA